MKGYNSTILVQRMLGWSPWPCRRCLHHQAARRNVRQQTASFSSSKKHIQRPRRTRILYATAGGTTFGLAALAFTDDIRHGYEAIGRTGRVASTLFVCINDYRVTLNESDRVVEQDERATLLKKCHKRCADRTLKVLEKNGSIFIKLGQHLVNAMNYLLPLEWTSTFIPLQDRCPVSSIGSIEEMFIEDTGRSIADFFTNFMPQPIGAASLAQVHLATIKETGQEVAVKVQHPSIAEWIDLDLTLTKFTFSTLKKWFPQYDLEWLSNEMEYSLPQELDFNIEGQNALRAKEYFSKIAELPLIIPDVLWAKKRILVMENVSGHRPDDLEFLDSNGIDRDEVSAALAKVFNEMIFGTNAPLHCDPHGGNIAIRKNNHRSGANFDVILYDHGLYRDIPSKLRRSYAKLWLAVIDANEPLMRKYSKEVANISDSQFQLFASAITGRDYTALTQSVATTRSETEKEAISMSMSQGMLQQLVQLLGQVPRIILLILKTNDLTRNLDENLHTRQGPVRTFLILARYCARTVFEEEVEGIRDKGGILWPRNWARFLGAWWVFIKVGLKLEVFEFWLGFRRAFGLGGSRKNFSRSC